MTDTPGTLEERLRRNSGWRNERHQCVTDPNLLTEAADEIASLRARVEAMEGALDDGMDQLHWINAQAENIMEATDQILCVNEEGAVARMMVDSMASDIGINAMMLHDKLTALTAATKGDGDGR